ncbi:hypothetical protein [Bradyrhizobium sp. CCBAU 11361]|uniref:hypothetical protein n=1 Tax=Bradyrhizobium sp. CCBAU 11361 TaxID=1630812 RepID=UPI003FA45465
MSFPLTCRSQRSNHDRYFLFEAHHLGFSGWQPEFACELQADMLILGVTIEMARRWFQNVGGWYAPGWNAPFVVSEDNRGFRLGA